MNPLYQEIFDRTVGGLEETSKPLRTFRTREKSVKNLEATIATALKMLGADTEDLSPAATHKILIENSLVVAEMTPPMLAVICHETGQKPGLNLLGHYIFQNDFPRLFIPDPKVEKDGFVYYYIIDILQNKVVNEAKGLHILRP